MQSSEQEPDGTATIKKRAALDSIPEDIALLIGELVKGWAVESKNLNEQEKARKTRDSTLRAIALSCRKNFHFYFPALLENVIINGTHLIHIQSLFQRENHGHLVRSLHLKPLPTGFTETAKSLLLNDLAAISGLPSSVDYGIRFEQGLSMLSLGIFRNVPSIETLIIESSIYIDGLFSERHTFLSNSLKKLYIDVEKDNKNNLSAKNTLWLLLFIPSLQQVALSLEFSMDDLRFLLEFGDTVEGLSRVSKLSLNIDYVWNASRSKTWWGLEEESYRNCAQGSQKTFAVSQLLRCVNTNQLISLEISGNRGDVREGDKTFLYGECLMVLHESFNSLLHLRLFGLAIAKKDRPDSICLSNFKNVKMLTLDGTTLYGFRFSGPKITVPSNLEIIWLPFYYAEEFEAEDDLIHFINPSDSTLPKLREVVVPVVPLVDGLLADKLSAVTVKKWTRMRGRLEKEEIFTSGRVILRKAEEGEMIGDPSRPGEVFLSTFRWISS